MAHGMMCAMANLLYPKPLARGARIAVTAPSSGVLPALHPRLNLALQNLRDQGFVVEEGHCLRDDKNSVSAPAAERAAELMQFLLRDDVDAVLPPWGGELACELLDLLDWPALAQARPKWLIGYSDTSTLLLALSLRLGWATAHGPCLMDLAPSQNDSLTSKLLAHLGTAAGGQFSQHQSSHWQKDWADFSKDPNCTYALTEATYWHSLHAAQHHPAHGHESLSGRLIGGCADTLMHLAGTAYGNVAGFIKTHANTGVILYLENAELSPTAWVRALHGLRWHGWLDGLAGVLVGRSAAPDTTGADQLRYAQALHDSLGHLPCPVLTDVDIGHLPPQMLLINGALAHVQWSAAYGGVLRQELI
jgi:muramoyltetrapeptide carboxypeptidase